MCNMCKSDYQGDMCRYRGIGTIRPLGPFLGSCDHRRNNMGERGDMGDEWISGPEAAEVLGLHRNTVYLSLRDPELRARTWGAEGVGWRYKPLSSRRIFEVSRKRAEQLAAGTPNPGGTEPPAG